MKVVTEKMVRSFPSADIRRRFISYYPNGISVSVEAFTEAKALGIDLDWESLLTDKAKRAYALACVDGKRTRRKATGICLEGCPPNKDLAADFAARFAPEHMALAEKFRAYAKSAKMFAEDAAAFANTDVALMAVYDYSPEASRYALAAYEAEKAKQLALLVDLLRNS